MDAKIIFGMSLLDGDWLRSKVALHCPWARNHRHLRPWLYICLPHYSTHHPSLNTLKKNSLHLGSLRKPPKASNTYTTTSLTACLQTS